MHSGETLKALFRPMTVMVPDLVLICENFLMAEGFVEAKSLASKFYGLYSLLSDLLSKQLHYDWGLRAVKSVLVVAQPVSLIVEEVFFLSFFPLCVTRVRRSVVSITMETRCNTCE